ncbi:MAG: hypothetical protein SGPRY_007955 [Prymnesium sp.]
MGSAAHSLHDGQVKPLQGGLVYGAHSDLQRSAFSDALTSHLDPASTRVLERWVEEWDAGDAVGAASLLLLGEQDGTRLAEITQLVSAKLLKTKQTQQLRSADSVQMLELAPEANCTRYDCTRKVEEYLAHATSDNGRGLVVLNGVDQCLTDSLFGDVIGGVERFMDSKGIVEVSVDGNPRQVR